MQYPIYVFACGCKYGADVIQKIKDDSKKFIRVLYCPIHAKQRLKYKIFVCRDCGKEIKFEHSNHIKRCKKCSMIKRQADTKRYNKIQNRKIQLMRQRMAADQLIFTDLKPNPIVTDISKSPCLQGCHLVNAHKTNTACLRCQYRIDYINYLDCREREAYL